MNVIGAGEEEYIDESWNHTIIYKYKHIKIKTITIEFLRIS